MNNKNVHIAFASKKTMLTTKDGQKIQAFIYEPETPVFCSFLISSEIGWPQKRYQSLCKILCQLGIRVVTFDHRGIGASPMPIGRTSLYQWGAHDLDAVILFVKNHYPKNELVYLGHGWAGQLVGLAPASLFFDRMIFINSMLSSFRLSSWKAWAKMYWNQWNNNTLPPGVLQEWLTWNTKTDGLFSIYSNRNYRKFQQPILACRFSEKNDIGFGDIKQLMAQFTLTTATYKEFSTSFLDSINLEEHKTAVNKESSIWKEIITWDG